MKVSEFTNAKERISSDKIKSILGLVLGERAHQFDAFLQKAPTSEELTKIIKELDKPEIKNVIFDLDGTLVPPYADIPTEIMDILQGYLNDDRIVAIYTNSAHTDRLNILRDAGIHIAETGTSKPSLHGFEIACDQCDMDPAHTAMIGNSPIADMPLVKNGEETFFPLNILINSIPPRRELVESFSKYVSAKVNHLIAVGAGEIVQFRNHYMIHDTDFE